MKKNSNAIKLGLMIMVATNLSVAGDYLLDSASQPVRDSSGSCIKVGQAAPGKIQAGCDAMDRVTLLPGKDGKVGAIEVTVGTETNLVNTAYAGIQTDESGKSQKTQSSADEINARFGSLLSVQPLAPKVFVVRFETGSATELTAESEQVIADMLADLEKREAPEIRVTGHTDTVGNLETNDRLSKQRAQTVVDVLVAKEIPLNKLEATGRGEREPAVKTADNVDEPANRRVEIIVR